MNMVRHNDKFINSGMGMTIGIYRILSSTNLPTDDNTTTPERISPKISFRLIYVIFHCHQAAQTMARTVSTLFK